MSKQIIEKEDQDLSLEDEFSDDDFSNQLDEMDTDLELDYEDTNWENNQLLKWQICRLIDKRKDAEKKSEKRRKQIVRLQRRSMSQRRKIHHLENKLKTLKKILRE